MSAISTNVIPLMPASISAQAPVEKTSRSFLDRVKAVGENLRNKSREDWAWIGANVAVGAAAKFGLAAAIGATVGITAVPALATAVAGGALVGITRSALLHLRASREPQPATTLKAALGMEIGYVQKDHFLSRKTLMTTASSAAISAATFGALSGFEHITGTSLGESLSKLAHKISDQSHALFDKALNYVAETDYVRTQISASVDKGVDLSQNLIGGSKATPTYETFAEQPKAPIVTERPVAALAKPEHVAVKTGIQSGVRSGPNENIDEGTRQKALAWVKKMNPFKAVAAPAAALNPVPAVEPSLTTSLPVAPVSAAASAAPQAVPASTPAVAEAAYPVTFGNGKTVDVVAEFGKLRDVAVTRDGIAPDKIVATCVVEPPTRSTWAQGIKSFCRSYFAQAATPDERVLTVKAGDVLVVRDVTAPAGQDIQTFVSGEEQSLQQFRAGNVEKTLLHKAWTSDAVAANSNAVVATNAVNQEAVREAVQVPAP